MVDVFEQVEEELRSDRYKRLARTWLPVAGVVLVVALVAALGWWGWDSLNSSKAAKAAEAYDRGMEALRADKPAEARLAFEEAVKEGNGAYKVLALQQQAGLAVTADKIPDAVRLFDEAAKASSDPILSDPPALKAAFLVMDTAPLADIEARLTPLAEDDRPLHAFAQEALALARLQHGKVKEAREALVLLQLGQDVPDDVRQRANIAVATIDAGTAGALKDIAAAAKTATPPAAGAANASTPAAPSQQ
ncbi:tetratricopeptide repeat protein [uncultured Brevundimonas sp.]|uniref:tetratricopeptide repeat protein n=1 Tax=uncultured Brevundimonas sp. TaxID=213418 RepID=UPI0026137E88|nr:tetratricopeptide repeat protein [uncultured Brevundimonas sp.]